MRYTPFLERHGITLKPDIPDNAANIIDSALGWIEETINWGEYEGRRRKPCPEQPLLLSGMPIGQYHCPFCGMMVMASMPHLSPAKPEHQDPDYYLGDYEEEYGQPWPPGYEEMT
jgi:hypothetical protein